MISSLERISTAAIILQPCAAGDQDLQFTTAFVKKALDDLTPARILVDLIENEKPRASRKLLPYDVFPVFSRIPVEMPLADFKGKR